MMATKRVAEKRASGARVRVNAQDVAKAAGVSISAVSRTFTPGASVSLAKREAILRAAQDLGYSPSVMARAMVKGRSSVIGLVLFGETNRHHPEVLLALTRAFEARSLRAMLFIVENDGDIARIIDHILSYRLDGVVAAAPIPAKDLKKLDRAGVPVIFYNRPGSQSCASVSCDHEAAGKTIARHLLTQGCSRFVLLGARDSYVAAERMRGVKAELEDDGATILAAAEGEFAYEDGYAAMSAWLRSGVDGFNGVIAANDVMAIGMLDAYVAAGHNVSEVGFAGFDGVDATRWKSHPIATLSQPIEAMARATAEMMSERLGCDEPMIERRLFAGVLLPVAARP